MAKQKTLRDLGDLAQFGREVLSPAAWLAAKFEEGKSKRVSVEHVVTPELAAAMLDVNTHNRPLRASSVDRFADVIKTGRWQLTHQGIAFDTERRLLDGQHRLNGIIDAGVAVPMMLSFGLSPEAFTAIDTGDHRRASDFISLDGVKSAFEVAAIGRCLIAIRDGHRHGHDRRVDQDELYKMVQSALPGISDCATMAIAIRGACCGGSKAGVGAALYLIGKHERRGAFVDKIKSGVGFMSPDDPCLRLRNVLVERKTNSPPTTAAMVVKAWNAFVLGETIRRLVWRDDEAFPVLASYGAL